MCKNITPLRKKKHFIGYKVAIKDNKTSNYYSPATGVEYKVDKVPELPTWEKALGVFEKYNSPHVVFAKSICDHNGWFHNSNMKGMTSVLVNYDDIFKLNWNVASSDNPFVILEMTINATHKGYFDRHCVILGSEILKIKEINI